MGDRLTFGGLLSLLDNNRFAEARRLYESASPKEQTDLLQSFRKGVEKGDAPEKALHFFKQIVHYKPTVSPMERIQGILKELKSRYNSQSPRGFSPGADKMVRYCRGLSVDEKQGWSDAAFLEKQKLALRLLLGDLDQAHSGHLKDSRFFEARQWIEQAFLTFYDPRRTDSDGDLSLDCMDQGPLSTLVNGETVTPQVYAARLHETFHRHRTNRLYSPIVSRLPHGEPTPLVLEHRGEDKPLAIVVPILLLSVSPEADVTSLSKKEAEIEKVLNRLMPPEWRRQFQIDIRFSTDPEAALAELDQVPYHVVRINDHPTSSMRTHMDNWSSRDSLETLAHEVGHHLGWPDRYSEYRTSRERILDPGWHYWAAGDLMGTEPFRYIQDEDLQILAKDFETNSIPKINEYAQQASIRDEIRLAAVQAASWRGDLDAVEELATGREEDQPVFYYYLGRSYEGEDPQRAAEFYKKAIERGNVVFTDPDRWYWLGAIGEFFSEQGDEAIMRDLLTHLQACCPNLNNHPAGRYYLWKWGVETTTTTEKGLRQYVAQYPNYFLGHYYLARFEFDKGNDRKALIHFREMQQLAGHNSWESLHLEPGPLQFLIYGETLERLGEPAEAIQAYSECLSIDPKNQRARQLLSRLLQNPKNEEGISLKESLALATTFIRLGESHYGFRLLKRAREAAASDEPYYYAYGDDLVRAALKEWTTYGPPLADLDYKLTFHDNALGEQFRRAVVALLPDVDSHRFNLAIALFRTGITENDQEYISEAMDFYATLQKPDWLIEPVIQIDMGDTDRGMFFHIYGELKRRGWLNSSNTLSILGDAIDRGEDLLVDSLYVESIKTGLLKPDPAGQSSTREAILYQRFYDYYSEKGDSEKIDELVHLYFTDPFFSNYSNAENKSILGNFLDELLTQAPKYRQSINETLRLDSSGTPQQVSALLREGNAAMQQGRFEPAQELFARAGQRITAFWAIVNYFGPPEDSPERELLNDAYDQAHTQWKIAETELEIAEKGETRLRYDQLGYRYRDLARFTKNRFWLKKSAEAYENAYRLLEDTTTPLAEKGLVNELVHTYEKMGDRVAADEWRTLSQQLTPR